MKYIDLSVLKIHKMSQEQYEREKAAGNIDENEIYVTPYEETSAPSVSLIGTWTVVENPEIPKKELPLEFTSNGTEYAQIGFSTTGPDSWGIYNLRYQSQDLLYDDAVYTNNPSGSYGIPHGWSDEVYRTITVTQEPTDADVIAWLGDNTDAPKVNSSGALPSYDASNEGQFLRIIGGVPAWSAVPNAEDNTF